MFIPFPETPQPLPMKEPSTVKEFERYLDLLYADAIGCTPIPDLVRHMTQPWIYDRLLTDEIIQSIHLTALRKISAALGDPLKDEPKKTAIDLADLVAEAIGSLPQELRMIEASLAYERATMKIENHCEAMPHEDELENGWYDLDSFTGTDDLDHELAYLNARRLIVRHPAHPQWVTIADEGEPYPTETAGA